MVKPGSLDPDMHLDLEVKWLNTHFVPNISDLAD